MRKLFTLTVTVVATGILVLGHARAQQAPASSSTQTPPASSSQSPAAKATAKPPAAKTGSTTARAPVVLTLKTPKDKASYAIGMNIGKSMHKDSVDIDLSILMRGIKDSMTGGKTLLTDDEAKAALTALQADMIKKMQAKGETFLAENKTKEGVVTLPSGLQYKILTEGTGPKPTAADTVVCNYRGTLIDNTEFDSSAKHGGPATFPVSGVIKGWTEALQLMPVGSKWQLFVPSELGYGARGGPGGAIGPYSALIFEVELLSIQPKAEVQTPKPTPNPTPKPTPNPTPNPNQ
jgi:FKBP-type peptidyl-prolyl cis-trans isomerase FklB